MKIEKTILIQSYTRYDIFTLYDHLPDAAFASSVLRSSNFL